MITVAHPATMLPPCAVESPCLAAGCPPMSTDEDPLTIESGGPEQVHWLPTVAAGIPPISTDATPGGRTGPPTWGLLLPGFTMGHV